MNDDHGTEPLPREPLIRYFEAGDGFGAREISVRQIIVNALGTTNLSGAHVLRWHLPRLCAAAGGRYRFTVLVHAGNRHRFEDLGPGIETLACPDGTASWITRVWWERGMRGGILNRDNVAALLMPSGMTVGAGPVPQVVLAMNPWALTPGVARGPASRLKAALQRMAYARAVRRADGIAYLSRHMQTRYHELAGRPARREAVVYTGIADDVAALAAMPEAPREPARIVTVSVMAEHKGIEPLIEALARLRRDTTIRAQLDLVGPWPCESYRRAVDRRIAVHNLSGAVTIHNQVPRHELLGLMQRARVFCLLSRCESFGIPAVEAQALGTPTVCSTVGAVPEVCGTGGLYVDPDDVTGAVDALHRLLTDDAEWSRRSRQARANAARFREEGCTRPFLSLIDAVTGSAGSV